MLRNISTMEQAISPIGSAVADSIKTSLADPAYRLEHERLAPYEEFARRVIARRGELGLTQVELAGHAGVAASTVSRIERGQHAIKARTRRRLTKALGMNPAEGRRRATTSEG